MRVAHLMYHELEQTGRALCSSAPGYVRYVVGDASFRSQLARIVSLGLHGAAVGGAMDAAAMGSVVVITFDDGCASDLEIAVKHGSTCVRVGTALLGQRPLTSP